MANAEADQPEANAVAAAAQAAEEESFEDSKGFWTGVEAIIEGVATEIVSALYCTDVGGQELGDKVQEMVEVHARGYHDLIAIAVFNSLMEALYRIRMKPVMGAAFTHAGQFMHDRGIVNMEHPNLAKASQATLTLGILKMLAPHIVKKLGFADLGILPGSWAARWQAHHGEVVQVQNLCGFLRDVGQRGPLDQTATGTKRRRAD